jgi:hypothetical protein
MKTIKAAAIPSQAKVPRVRPGAQNDLKTDAELAAAIDARKRAGDLQRLLAVWPAEIADVSIAGRRRTVRRLEKALRQERARGRAGHWTYDIARHHQLAHHLRLEQTALQKQEHFERHQHSQILAAETVKARL